MSALKVLLDAPISVRIRWDRLSVDVGGATNCIQTDELVEVHTIISFVNNTFASTFALRALPLKPQK